MHTYAHLDQPAYSLSLDGAPPPLPRPSGVVRQDKSSGGSADTTKTRSGPQRVRMCSGERPIGAAKGKQTKTMALCQPPPPPLRSPCSCRWCWVPELTYPA